MQIFGTNFNFSNEIEPNGKVYTNKDGDEAIIDYSNQKERMQGSIKRIVDGSCYAIEKCKSGHFWKVFDCLSFETNTFQNVPEPNSFHSEDDDIEDEEDDDGSIVTYSVMIYYTPEFAAVTSDIEGWVDLVLDEANQGYENSQIPVRVEKFCIEEASIGDDDSTLENFTVMKGTAALTRKSADAAVLFSKDSPIGESYCGIAWVLNNPYWFGEWSFSVTRKDCAIGYYTFGHELGHNFGCQHNIEQDVNSVYAYGHGHLIAAGNGVEGSTTILAYTTYGHLTRANYYSNPDMIYPPTGTPLGVVGVSNNAKVITDVRIAFAAVGDESGTCLNPGKC